MQNPQRILAVLDDDPAVSETISMVAEGEGFSVHPFTDALTFLDALPALQPSREEA